MSSFVLTATDGKTQYIVKKEIEGFSLKNDKRKIIIFDIFATWCPPCRKEMPDFNDISQEYKGRAEIIAINIGREALPRVIEKHPDIIYIIVGKTHPNVVRSVGEEYRNYLKLLVEKNNLRKHVYFFNKYVSNEELFEYLSAIDIYITPYLNEAQITSGTLSYAIGAGAAVISTPYWHFKQNIYGLINRFFFKKSINTLTFLGTKSAFG